MKKIWIYGLGMALGLVFAGTSWALDLCTNTVSPFDSGLFPICGDSVGVSVPFFVGTYLCVPGDIPCFCGDTVHTDTKLDSLDPIVFSTCSGDGLTVASDVSKFDCASFLLLGSGGGDGLFLDLDSNVLIKSCVIKGFIKGIDVLNSSHITFEDIKAFFNEQGIVVFDSDDVTIHDAFASKNIETGIEFDNVSVSNVQGNRMENNGHDGFSCDNDCFTVTAQQNQANNNGQDGIEFKGLGDGNKVLNNTARGNCPSCTDEGNGISLEADVTGTIVTGNRVTGNHRGIFLEGSTGGSTVSGNYASSNTGPGIDIHSNGNTVSGNGGERNGGNGLEVDDGGIVNTLSKNIFNRNGGHGICTDPGNIDGGGNKGVKNGTPPDVNINGGGC